MKKNIAFFVTGLEAGGIERYLLRFLKYYKDSINATIYCKSGMTGILEKEFLEVNTEIIKYKISNYLPTHFLELKKELKKRNFDSVVDFTNNFAAFQLFAAKKAGIKSRIVWYRNAEEKFTKTTLRVVYNKLINRITKKYATNILSNSISAFNHFFKDYNWKKDERFQVIYNGINVKSFIETYDNLNHEFKIPENAFVVGHVGRFNDQKNHKTILEVANKLCNKYPNFYFILCGKGVSEKYKDYVRQIGLEKRIIMPGVRNDINKMLNTFDCFFFPSTIEGNPNALIEAMISGLPIVASNIEPIKEATPKNAHSSLKEPFDVDGFSENIESIYHSTEFSNSLIFKDWAIKNYDDHDKFYEFYQKLQ